MPGGRAAPADAAADGEAAVLAVGVALAAVLAAWPAELLPPQAASIVTAAVAARDRTGRRRRISGSIGKVRLADGGTWARQAAFEREVGDDPDSTGRARQYLDANRS
jgi:hypothetical protein